MVFPWEPKGRRKDTWYGIWDTAGYKRVSHASEGMCVYDKWDDDLASRN